MRLTNQFFRRSRLPGKRRIYSEGRLLSRMERSIIRVMVILAVLLGVFQLKAAKDPLDFYFQVTGYVEAPALKFDSELNSVKENEYFEVSFDVVPYAPVKVWQDDELLGVIAQNQNKFKLHPGTVILDAREIVYPVYVEFYTRGKKQHLTLNKNIKSIILDVTT